MNYIEYKCNLYEVNFFKLNEYNAMQQEMFHYELIGINEKSN
jgi:hypothetical protein